MDNKRILEKARLQIPDLASVGQDIYKGTLTIDEKVAGIYYFDLSNNIPDDFDNYQEQLLSDEFYDNPGSKQWNYYLFLLNDTLSDERKRLIERDDRYARKFVLDEEGFDDFFHFEEANKEINNNIVSQWKQALDSADLQEVYGQETYVDIFERFSSNSTRKNKAAGKKVSLVEVDRITFVDRVLLKDNFRKYPKDLRDLKFGRVNLLHGINGVGKTSVFESIELMLCGATYRNEKQVNPNRCIEASYNHSGKMVAYQAKNPSLYQSRDLEWYATTNNRGNTLFNSFNRFNYFNADAAQKLSAAGSEEEISEALIDIVLGPEFSHIKDRSTKMMTRVSPAYKKIEVELAQMRQKLAQAVKVIKERGQPDNVNSMLEEISQVIADIQFLDTGLNFSSQPSIVEQQNNRVQVTLSYLMSNDMRYDTRDNLQQELLLFKEKKTAFTKLIADMKTHNSALSEHQKNLRRLETDRDVVSRAISYLQDGRFIQLRGIDEKIKGLSFTRQKKLFVKTTVAEGIKSAPPIEIEITAFLEQLRTKLATDEAEKGRLDKEVVKAMGKLGKVEALLKQIKLSGAEFLELDKSSINCPMCRSKFDRSELEDRISQVDIAILGNTTDLVEENRKKANLLVEQMANSNVLIQNIEKVSAAYNAYFDTTQNVTVKEAVKSLAAIIVSITETDAEIKRLNEVLEFGKLSGKFEQDLRNIDFALQNILEIPVETSLSELGVLTELKSGLEAQISAQESGRLDITEKRYAVGLEIKALLGYPAEHQIDAKVAEETFKKDQDKLEILERYFIELASIVRLKTDDSIIALRQKSDLLRANIASYRDALKVEVELNSAKKEEAESLKFIAENDIKYERLKKAYETLKTLSENEESSKQLEFFFNQNFREIADIFRSIHSPREFSDLRYTGKKISLLDENGDIRGITEISTGQRSALALSIFLSLNKKLVEGPNLIMFDDPVAFIDDFNALSFLDYLRNYVLRSGRQFSSQPQIRV
jgi:exonuclease SbcC